MNILEKQESMENGHTGRVAGGKHRINRIDEDTRLIPRTFTERDLEGETWKRLKWIICGLRALLISATTE